MTMLETSLMVVLRLYRTMVSPVLVALFAPMGFGCRFTPTCSEYAMDAVRTHGAMRGTALTVGRLCRCHPWGHCGYDPVPAKQVMTKNANLTLGRVPGGAVNNARLDHSSTRNCQVFSHGS